MENLMLDLIDGFLDIDEKKKEVWTVRDDFKADWAIDRIIEEKVALRRFEIAVNNKVSQLQMKLKKEQEKANREIEFFESKLREYFDTVKDKAKDSKTQKVYKLPSGSLKMKKEVITFDYDKAKLLEYAETEELEDLIKVTKEFKWVEFKKILEIKGNSIINIDTGEIIEVKGLTLETNPEIFSVEV